MEIPPPVMWSELPLDILRSVLERLNFVDFQRTKMVCSNWYAVSKQTVHRKSGSPWLMLFLDNDDCALYNPDEERIYRTLRDFSGIRFLANSGKWFLVLDSLSNLYIIDVFSENRIDLPPIESIQTNIFKLKRAEDNKDFIREKDRCFYTEKANDLRGLLWVDEKTKEYVVVWFFSGRPGYLGICKKGHDHYSYIPVYDPFPIPKLFNGIIDVVVRGYRLYILTTRRFLRVIDLSGQQGYQEITDINQSPLAYPERGGVFGIVVKKCEEVVFVENVIHESEKCFCLYKRDPNADMHPYNILEIDSLGDEALLHDLGITVMANNTLGIEPNTIYFSHYDRSRSVISHMLDI